MSHRSGHTLQCLQRAETPFEPGVVISSDLHSFRSESEGPEPFDIQISIVENILLDKLNHIRLFYSVRSG